MRQNSNLVSSDSLTDKIRSRAEDLGFDSCGIAAADLLSLENDRLKDWIKGGYHAGMSYMERNGEKRKDPRNLVEGARSVIVLLMNYYQHQNLAPGVPVISRYALGRDYHDVMRERMLLLLDYIKKESPGSGGRVFVDSAPVMERSWAVNAGLGWIGRNSMLINRRLGSYTFIGEIVTDIELDYDKPFTTHHCGSCNRCTEACPTGAILPDRTVDSNRCISYITIEHKGAIPGYFSGKMENRVFGCDICQEVCPWNSKANQTTIADFFERAEIPGYTKHGWDALTEEQFIELFASSPVKRAGYQGFMRNLRFIRTLPKIQFPESP